MKNKTFFSGALILIIFNLISKALGAIYRIPLAGILGGVGVGQYQLVFPLYSLLLTISTSGIPVAISKMVAEFNVKKQFKDARNLLYISLLILSLISMVGFLIIVAFAKNIASIQGNPSAYICYYALSPAVLFVGVISAFRGYFQGNLNMIPTALSNFIEQLFKMIFGLCLAKMFAKMGTVYSVLGALVGISLSELICCMFLGIYYLFYIKRKNNNLGVSNYSLKILSKNLIKISVPITLGGLITPISSILDSFLVVNLLMFTGLSSTHSTCLLGLQGGVVEPLIHLPVVIASSISTVLLPSISTLKAEGSNEKVVSLVKNSMQICLTIALAFVSCYVIFGRQILELFYSRSFSKSELLIATKLLFLSSVNIIFLSLVQITAGVLQGLGMVKKSVKTLAIGCTVKIIFEIILVSIKKVNIYGVVLSALLCYIVIFLLNLKHIKSMFNFKMTKIYQEVLIQGFVVCLSAYLLNNIFMFVFSELTSALISGVITIIIFFVSYYLIFMKKKNLNNINV